MDDFENDGRDYKWVLKINNSIQILFFNLSINPMSLLIT